MPARAEALARGSGPNVRVVNSDLRELTESGFDRALVDAPCSGLGVLARRPDLRWRSRPLPELQLELLRAGAERVKPGGTIVYAVCTMNADENEAVVDASGLEVEPLAEWPRYAHPKRPEFLLTLPHRDNTAGFFIARLRPNRRIEADAVAPVDPHRRGRAVALCGRLLDHRRADRGALRAGTRVFHFDVGDGHFVEPITMGPIVLQSISPLIHRFEGAVDVHLMVEKPSKYFESIAAAGGDSATFHFEAVDDVGETIREAREHGLQVGVAFNPETEPEQVAEVAAEADLVLCMAIHPGYSGQPFRPDTLHRVRRLRALLPDEVLIQVDGGVSFDNIRAALRRGRAAAGRGLGDLRVRRPAARVSAPGAQLA